MNSVQYAQKEMSMKKLITILLLSFLMIGCSTVQEGLEEKPNPTEIEKPSPIENKVDLEALHKGDASSLAGTYENSKGVIIVLNDEGLRDDINEMYHEKEFDTNSSGLATRSQYLEGQVTGYALSVFDVGFTIETVKTDTTKVRISYGHDFPLTEEQVYYKK